MRTSNIMKAASLVLMATVATTATAQKMDIEHKGDTTIIRVDNPTKYILLPIQEEKDEAQVLLDTGSKDDTTTMCPSRWDMARPLPSRYSASPRTPSPST